MTFISHTSLGYVDVLETIALSVALLLSLYVVFVVLGIILLNGRAFLGLRSS